MRAAMELGTKIPKLCATDMLDAFGSCRLCLVEIEGRPGTPASCTTPVAAGMVVRTQTDRLKRLRKGVMELYISDHPLDCLTCAANGDCELQDMAGAVGLREVRYGYDGDKHPNPGQDESNPYFTYDPSQVHRLLALRARLRGGAGHLRADHRRPRLRLGGLAGHGRVVPRLRMRVLRRLRAGLPDRDADREVGHRDRPAGAFGGDDLRLLRRRLLVQGGDARRRSRAHGAVQGRQGQSRPFLRQGPLRLGLRQAPRAHPEADDPRARSPIRGAKCPGTRRSAASRPSSSASRRSTGAARSAASPRRAAPTKKPSWCRSWCAPASATTTSTPARASATRRPATA